MKSLIVSFSIAAQTVAIQVTILKYCPVLKYIFFTIMFLFFFCLRHDSCLIFVFQSRLFLWLQVNLLHWLFLFLLAQPFHYIDSDSTAGLFLINLLVFFSYTPNSQAYIFIEVVAPPNIQWDIRPVLKVY